ncbi:MAG TPA: DUF1800 domain-containing protein [Candidatus Angelobacter sp.]|nr:DUF1800 domain-containing protein [Candidatus Angelobacter sp.]
MPALRRIVVLLGLLLTLSAVLVVAGDKKSKSKNQTADPALAQMDDDKRILHALNRFTFGVRPGDVERVRAMGLDKWFDQQLHPDQIDDGATEARLAPFRTLRMSTREMVDNFPTPQVVKAIENGRKSLPSDPAKRAIYEARLDQLQQRQENKAAKAADNANTTNNTAPDKALEADMKVQPANDDASMLSPEDRQKIQKKREVDMYADLGAKPAQPAPAQSQPAPTQSQNQPGAKRREDAMFADLASDQLLQQPPEQRYKTILSMNPQERMDLLRNYRGERAQRLTDGMKPDQVETIMAIINPQVVVGGELTSAKLLRAIYSERQLDEVMTDFWYNHFNVFIGKGPDRYMITAYERDVIRPHALGKFKDLLVATAKSPAMLFYLDNWQSVGPNSDLAKYGPAGRRRPQYRRGPFGMIYQVPPRPPGNNRNSGLNENYAREIMELHTLGVDGGYTQKDVTELAKVLTGWSIDQPQRGGSFKYNDRAHEPGKKYVLGHKIGDHGESEGMEMLDILAHHPSTARFISKKLAMRFVSDNPPQSLIDRMADTFIKKDGDIREVLRTMFHAPEFWAADAYRAKMKTPFEFVVSSVRASGVEVQNAVPLVQFLNRMGMPLYGMQPPTGYSMKAETWVNSAALLSRMNFALQLGTGKLPGTTLDPQTLLHGAQPRDADSALAVLENSILSGDVSPQTHAVIQKQLTDPQVAQRRLDDPGRPPNFGAIAGLIMGSPEFQRR